MGTYIFKILTPSLLWSSALSAIIKTSITLYLTERWLEEALVSLKFGEVSQENLQNFSRLNVHSHLRVAMKLQQWKLEKTSIKRELINSWVKLFDCSSIEAVFGALFPMHKKWQLGILASNNSAIKSLYMKFLAIDRFSRCVNWFSCNHNYYAWDPSSTKLGK